MIPLWLRSVGWLVGWWKSMVEIEGVAFPVRWSVPMRTRDPSQWMRHSSYWVRTRSHWYWNSSPTWLYLPFLGFQAISESGRNGNIHPSIQEWTDSNGEYLVGGDWNHGMDYDFPETVGNVIFIKWRSPSFFKGVGSITKQKMVWCCSSMLNPLPIVVVFVVSSTYHILSYPSCTMIVVFL